MALVVAIVMALLLPAAPREVPGSSPGHPWTLGVNPVTGAATANGWQVVSSVTTPGWTGGATAPVQGSITCPMASRCYLYPKASGTSASAPAARSIKLMQTSFFVSTDGGRHWSASGALPSGIRLTTSMSCPTGDGLHCLAGGEATNVTYPVTKIGFVTVPRNAAYLLATPDGGATWSERPLPAGIGSIADLSCSSESQCVAVIASRYDLGVLPIYGQLYVTTDGGSTWRHIPTPPYYQGYFVSCHGLACVSEGEIWKLGGGAPFQGALLYSTNGGISWKAGKLPPGFATSNMSYLTCSDASYCLVTGSVREVQALASTSDGGATWTLLPRHPMGMAFEASCPAAGVCWVGTEGSGGAPALMHTTNGGISWTEVSLPPPPPQAVNPDPGGPTPIGQVKCPTVSECIATAMVYPGQESPIYTYSAAA